MDELRKLETEQSMLSLMEEHGFRFPVDDPHLRSFLSDLLRFMVQPFKGVDFKRKCELMNNLPKISVSFLEDASHLLVQECSPKKSASHTVITRTIDFEGRYSCEVPSSAVAAVSLDAMRLANSSLEDFCRSYFMFHKMDPTDPRSIFKHLPVLAFTESYIYQLDALNERRVDIIVSNTRSGVRSYEDIEEFNSLTDDLGPLVNQLESCSLMTRRIRNELQRGEEYWRLERKLCTAVTGKNEISIADVLTAIHLKSFDYRVLNLLLYEMQAEKVNDQVMEFLSVSEFLVEVSDDLYDYEDDVLDNNFNVLRMFAYIYGASTAPGKLIECIADAETKYARLLESLDPDLALKYQSRCKDATKEGGMFSGPPLGTWTIPPIIADEELYRLEHKNM